MAMDQSGAVMAFYSQSYALVRFLKEAAGGRYRIGYQQMLRDGFSGRWPLSQDAVRIAQDRNLPRTIGWNRLVGSTLFTRYVGADLDRLDQEYGAYCRRMLNGKSYVWLDEPGLFKQTLP
jgi:hypothetical protein